jgi:hypothetical protein
MRLSVGTLRQVVKWDLPIAFVAQQLTSYGGFKLATSRRKSARHRSRASRKTRTSARPARASSFIRSLAFTQPCASPQPSVPLPCERQGPSWRRPCWQRLFARPHRAGGLPVASAPRAPAGTLRGGPRA